jgi:uncharacterized protein (DUF305 family)
MRTSSTIAVLVAALVATACSAGSGAGPATRPARSNAAEIERIYRARMDSARTRYAEADVRFMTGMIGHHAQAIVMSRLVPTHGASPSLVTLAGRIINAQQDEIANMQQWLRDRGQPVPEVHITETAVMVHGADHAMHMPGMLTPEQLRQLEQARGSEFDRLFLRFMIQHHQGAVTMVHELFKAGGAGQDDAVFKIASDIQADQTTEIARMEKMLAALPGRDLQ